MRTVDNLIVGGGLAGLSLARHLHRSGQSFALIEARDRLGGRIAGHERDGEVFDLGPAWFWPGQPRIAALLTDLNLGVFEQFSSGAAVYEDEQKLRQTAHGFASMAGSFRVAGGFSELIRAIETDLPQDQICKKHALKKLVFKNDAITAITTETTFLAKSVILALPPRVAADIIEFEPALPKDVMANVPTWMAGQAKAIAIYDTPFWRNEGLSGDGASRSGPLVEIHDASPNSSQSGALFGFIGVPVVHRRDEQALRREILSQLGRLFGPEGAQPKELVLKDWAFDRQTATELDHQPLYTHPKYGMPVGLTGLYDGRLFFGSTEVAPEFGGYLEGALEAAENAFASLSGAL